MNKIYNNTTQKIDNLVRNHLPSFAGSFFRANRQQMTESSLYAYALDLAAFFEFICKSKNISIKEVSIKDFESISEADIENYMECIRVYNMNGSVKPRSNYTLRRSFAVLHSFFNFLYSEGIIEYIPTLRVRRPKYVKRNPVIPSNNDNIALINFILTGNLPIERAAAFQVHFRERDTAIVTLMVCVGLRTTECVNLNMSDLNLADGIIHVSGRRHPYLSISDFVIERISKYLALRLEIIPEHGDEQAVFLSLRGTRVSPRSVQLMIKKYSSALFGKDKPVIGRDLSFSFINQVYNASKSLSATAMLSGRSTETIARIYTADMLERLAETAKVKGVDSR